ncbi:hypothetical protein MPTK1_1g04540 [Marchantia polymorpha subsp. ruderalis]|uniref:RNase III domain-containing protein n=2 Tax=Marchantia polymorpha TaxID=3197 RepID=A0AAF6ALH3_MARPO|nr:hypothetical protein MARPO_0005s0153 [Marchantia polymorpha]BBM97293.1 hypothetical protein Mp_1g04540 [Marchantia polymorpha subsp. ruderalis]|eukprot:PTQ48513.1 hypothetical protein MARPO_0005s0153 [Marchantia polymorpha]
MMATMHTLGIVVPSNGCCTRRNYNSRSEAEFCGGKIVPRRARGFVAGVEAVDLAELFNLRRNAPERVREVQAVGKSSRIWASVSEVDEAPKKIKKVEQKQLILKPPLSDSNLAERFLSSPQLQVKKFPLLSSCLPVVNLNRLDQEWIDEYLIEVKDALGYSIEILEAPEDSPASHLDSLLFLAFQHKFSKRGRTKLVGIGHSRLAFLGQYVLELAFSELLLQMYPTERVGSLRERVFNVTNKRVLPKWLYKASLNAIVFPAEETEQIPKDDRQVAVRSVFWALIAANYLTLGMPEVYRILFEVFGIDLEAPEALPKPRTSLPDEDYLSPDLERKLTWQEIAAYQAPEDSLFSSPRLFRACVPPGMHRFRGNEWEILSLPKVMEALEYPRPVQDSQPEITEARNIELGLGLQLCFLHPCKFKGDHPRFCYDRLEYIGQKIQDVILAEQLLMKHLDGPAIWLERKHRLQLMNRLCGRTLREKKLTWHIAYDEERKELFEKNRRLRNFATTSVQHAIHGLGYLVYGRSDVRRLMSKIFPVEHLIPRNFL